MRRLKPKQRYARKVFLGQFFQRYDRAKFPGDIIAKNVLQQEFGVPPERAADVLTTLKDNGAYVGLIHQTKTGPLVSTQDLQPTPVTLPDESGADVAETSSGDAPVTPTAPFRGSIAAATLEVQQQEFRVFITHGRAWKSSGKLKICSTHTRFRMKSLLRRQPPFRFLTKYSQRCVGVVPELWWCRRTTRRAAAAGTINNNVLIEIGAAFVLYDQRVVLLWDKRLKVPSNLQGLYRCEFDGGELSFANGTKLAKAIKQFSRLGQTPV